MEKKRVKFSASLIRQGKHRLFTWTIPSDILSQCSFVSTRDDNGRTIKKEYLTWNGYYEVKDHRGVPDHANLEVGKYDKLNVVVNPSRNIILIPVSL